MPYLGSDEFRAWAYGQRVTDDDAVSVVTSIQFKPSIAEIVAEVATAFSLTRTGSIPTTIGKLKLLMENDRKLCKKVESLMSDR